MSKNKQTEGGEVMENDQSTATVQNEPPKSKDDNKDLMQFIADFPGIRMPGNYLEIAFKTYCRNNKINDRVSQEIWVKRFEHFKSNPPSKPLPEDIQVKTKQKVGGK